MSGLHALSYSEFRVLTRGHCRFMADKIMPLTEAVEGYRLFNEMKAQKVVFDAQK